MKDMIRFGRDGRVHRMNGFNVCSRRAPRDQHCSCGKLMEQVKREVPFSGHVMVTYVCQCGKTRILYIEL